MAVSMTGARLDRLPICSFHYRLLALISAGMFIDAFDIYLMGPVLAELVRTKWTTPADVATFISITFLGLFLGTVVSGWLGDRFGRRTTYQLNLLIFGLASLAAAAAPNYTVLLICRFVAGIGLGGEIVTGYATLAEFVPARNRGNWQGYLITLTNAGLPASAFVALAVIPSLGWRWMFVIPGVLALIVWLMRKNMPESPRWCEIHGRKAEADAILTKTEAAVEKATGKSLPSLSAVVSGESVDGAPAMGLGALFRGVLLRRVIIGVLLMVFLNFGYTFLTWVPTILLQSGKDIFNTLLLTSIMQLGAIPGGLIGGWGSDRLGRRGGIIAFSVLITVFAVVFGFMKDPMGLAVIGFMVILGTYALAAVIYTYVPELFPTAVRLRGAGTCIAVSRVTNAMGPYAVAFILTTAGATGVFIVVGAVVLLNAIVMGAFGEETRGKSLETIGEDVAATPHAPLTAN
ncbi:MAG: MFS transporter [Chloroflexota bacterium]|nr:MAG: MFS transporter [Chloroflexota bacterium]